MYLSRLALVSRLHLLTESHLHFLHHLPCCNILAFLQFSGSLSPQFNLDLPSVSSGHLEYIVGFIPHLLEDGSELPLARASLAELETDQPRLYSTFDRFVRLTPHPHIALSLLSLWASFNEGHITVAISLYLTLLSYPVSSLSS